MSSIEQEALKERVDAALESLRPHLKVDGGDIEVVEVTEDMTVRVKWLGNCEFCSMSAMTMKAGVEQTLRSKIPEIKTIEAVNGMT
jgi:Fe-S cluster biogenesis protein NfuA